MPTLPELCGTFLCHHRCLLSHRHVQGILRLESKSVTPFCSAVCVVSPGNASGCTLGTEPWVGVAPAPPPPSTWGLPPKGLAVAGAVGRHAPGMGPGLREQQAGWVSPPLTSSPLRWPGQRAGDQRGKGELTKKSQKVFACHSVLGYLSCALGCCPLRCFCEVPDGLGQMPLQCPFLLKPHCAGAVGSPPTHVASTRPSSAHWPLPV